MNRQKSSPHDCVNKLKVLADSTRLAVIRMLMNGPRHVGELNAELEIDQSLLSHHLRILRDAGLVTTTRDGKAVLYDLAPDVEIAGTDRDINLGCCRLSFAEETGKKS